MAETALSNEIDLTEPDLHSLSEAALEAADNSNGNSFSNSGVEALIVDNTTGGNVTITFRDKDGNTINAGATTIAANQTAVFGPFDPNIYGTTVTFTASSASVQVLVVDLTRKKTLITRKKLA